MTQKQEDTLNQIWDFKMKSFLKGVAEAIGFVAVFFLVYHIFTPETLSIAYNAGKAMGTMFGCI